MKEPREFHYRLPGRAGGFRPGSHPGSSFGAGQQFAMHARLVDHPDPRRLDLRASVQSVRGDWLVRLHLQRVAVPVQVVVDVSASMHFGKERSKLDVVADFVEALGFSAFRSGDRVGMTAFDTDEREDLFVPPRYGRGGAEIMSAMLRAARTGSAGGNGGNGARGRVAREIGHGTQVAFVTDGQEAPPLLPSSGPATDIAVPGVGGWLIGVGGDAPAPIPKTDESGNRTGYWLASEVIQIPPAERALGAGESHEERSALQGQYLAALAERIGFGYRRLSSAASLSAALNDPRFARRGLLRRGERPSIREILPPSRVATHCPDGLP